jgi:P4 family phage/plasmid primase-like protien
MNTIKSKVSKLIQSLNWIGPNDEKLIIYNKKKFLLWNGKAWIKHSKDEIYDIIVRTAHETVGFLEDTKDIIIRDLVRNLSAISSVPRISKGKRRSNPDEVGVTYKSHRNGLLRIQVEQNTVDVALIPFDSDVMVTSVRDYPFDPQAQCPRFIKFINEVLPTEEIPFIQEWMGLCLIPINPTQKFLVAIGSGANGKSATFHAFNHVIGEDDVSNVPLKEFLPNAKFGLILTEDKLLNIAEELDDYGYLASSALKNYVTQGKIIVQEKHQNLYTIKATAKLMFATNFLPKFRDNTDGLTRRMEILSFNNQFLNPTAQDKEYSNEDFWKNTGELPGMLNWAIEGLKRLAHNNWCFTASHGRRELLETYKLTINPAVHFLKEYVEPSEVGEIVCRDLFQLYEKHCKTFGLDHEDAISFGRQIKPMFPAVEHSNRSRSSKDGVRSHIWVGLRYKNDDENAQIAQITPNTIFRAGISESGGQDA